MKNKIKKNIRKRPLRKKLKHDHYLTGTMVGDDVLFLILGVIIGFIIPFLICLSLFFLFFNSCVLN